MNILKKSLAFSLTVLAALGLTAESVTLENDYMKIIVEPDAGARISSWELKKFPEKIVKTWNRIKSGRKIKKAKKAIYSGGALGGHMCGAYQDEQLDASYKIVSKSNKEIVLRWLNKYVLFDGLEETRTVKLDGNSLKVNFLVKNTGKEKRVIYYRLQDFIGTGNALGEQAVTVYPSKEGITATAFQNGETKAIMNLKAPWYAQVNHLTSCVMKVTASGAPLRNIMFYTGSSSSRTGEFFWVPATLSPGETWEAAITYSFTDLKDEKGELAPEKIANARLRDINKKQVPAAFNCKYVPAYGNAVITPVSAGGVIPQGMILERFKSMSELSLSGAKGEIVLGAFSLTARKNIASGKISFGEFKDEKGNVLAIKVDPYFITRDGADFMTRNWKFADGFPVEAANTKSKVPYEKAITPFALKADESAHFRIYLEVPKEAKGGTYTGKCFFDLAGNERISFDISLKVWDFALELPKDKGYGAFSTFSLLGDKHGASKFGSTKAEFKKAIAEWTKRNWRNYVLYMSNPENILWALDEFAAAGWRDARFVLIRPHVPYKELMKRYGKYNFTFLPWGIDEPINYNMVKECAKKYVRFQKNLDYPNMNFSANTPLSLAIMDSLPKTHPTIAVTGNVMYFVDKTRELAKQNRMNFWYAGTPKKDVAGRLLRGIYVWKEPTAGMMDWGEMAGTSRMKNSFHAFLADGELRPSQKLENMTQGLTDLLYLNTLEQTIKRAKKDSSAAKEGQKFLDWIRGRFGIDYTGEAAEINFEFLDMIRSRAAVFTENILNEGK